MSSLSLVKENKNKKNEDNTNDAIEKKKKKKNPKVCGRPATGSSVVSSVEIYPGAWRQSHINRGEKGRARTRFSSLNKNKIKKTNAARA